MLDNQYFWFKRQTDKQFIQKIEQHFSLDRLTSTVLAGRFSSVPLIEDFFSSDLNKLVDPSRLDQIELLKKRLISAIDNQEKITIYGDYDADGITSTSILLKTLQILGARVDYFIPNRFRDGYGPNKFVYQQLIDTGTKLIFAVDNGISGFDAVDLANRNQVDVLIADHHQLPKKLPNAKAIIHPDLSDDYPFKNLSAAGIAFKVSKYLLGTQKARQFLPLVAIGEIADVMPLINENRILIQTGIDLIKSGENKGLQEVIKRADLKLESLTAQDIAFKIAPRLNSLGRMADSGIGVELLTTDDSDKVSEIAKQVEHLNKQRQKEADKIYRIASRQVSPQENNIIIVSGENWHEGIIGIIAGRLSAYFGRPAVVFSVKNGIAKGSARSTGDFDLYKVLDRARDLYISFGGHKQAAGLSLKASDLDRLDKILNADDYHFSVGRLAIDAVIKAGDLSIDSFKQLSKLAPFGEGNPEPIFDLDDVELVNLRILGSDKKHFKLKVNGFSGDILFFNRPDLIGKLQLGERLSIVGTLSLNEWKHRQSLQIIGKDIRSENRIPDRNSFSRIYHYYCAKNVLYSPNDFFQKVFLELGFVRIVNGVVFVVPEAKHAELSQSYTYRKRAENGY